MENQEKDQENPITGDGMEMEKDEIINPEQFQVSRSPEEDEEDADAAEEDAKYTPEENEFADGKGTELAEEFDEDETDESDELLTEEDEFGDEKGTELAEEFDEDETDELLTEEDDEDTV